MKLTLYYAPVACSLVPLISLHEAGAQFDVHPVSLKNGEQKKPEYLKVNPKGKVPALSVDGDILTENVAILSFLARSFPDAKLLPTDPKNSIKALSLMGFCGAGMHPPLTRINGPQRFCDVPGTEESVRKLALEEVIKNFKVADGILAGREWLFDHWTAVDAYFFWVWRRFGLFNIPIPSFPNYAAHGERMMKRASVQKAFALEKEVQAKEA
ncbi:MAG: glutathione S-transferase family protein [Burkholderiales bacterium]